jgi:hypothetical protein
MNSTFVCKACVAGLAMATALGASAQKFPEKPIRLVVPFAPGGNIDITARTIAPGMSEALGTQVVRYQPTTPMFHGTNSWSPSPSSSLLLFSPDAMRSVCWKMLLAHLAHRQAVPSRISPQLMSMSSSSRGTWACSSRA